MLKKIIAFFQPPVFPDDEEKTRRARALNALQLNMGIAILILGSAGILFFFAEKSVTSIILCTALLITVAGMILNRRGWVTTAGFVMLIFLWVFTVAMTVLSSGMQSLDVMFFISGTVVAGIILGGRGAYAYAGLSLLTGLGLILAGIAGFEFPQLFTFPPLSAWILLFINLIFTVVPLQVALQSLSDSALRSKSNEERYRLIASVMSDYAFSIEYGTDGKITDQWISGAFESITGYTPDEYIARGGWVSILHPDDREQDARDMTNLLANRTVITEVRIIRKDGEIRWVRSYGHPKWDEENDRLAGIYGAVQDITGRKRVDAELQQRADEVSLLYRLGVALSGGENLYQALRAFVGELKQVMPLDAFHIGLYDAETDVFSYSLFLNLDKDILPPPRKLKENPGLTWEVISTRKTLYLRDVADPQVQQDHQIVWVVDAPIRSYLGIPLTLQDRVIGIMSVQATQPESYTLDQIRLLETIATQVAITIEKLGLLEQVQQELVDRKRIEAELRQRADEVSLLYRLGLTLSGGQDLYEALRAFMRELKQVMTVDAFHIGLYDPETDLFSYTLFLNLDEDLQPPPRNLRKNPGLTWEVISSRKTLYLPDMNDLQTRRDYNAVIVSDVGIRSYVGIPLFLQDRVIGVMSVQGLPPAAYTPDQIRLLETIAAQVASTIEKLGLLEQVQQELAERKRAETELQKREAILEVVADAANTFLKISEWDADTWRTEVNSLLKRLVITIQASHAYIFENHIGGDGSTLMSMRYEGTAPGFTSDLSNPKYTNMPMADDQLENWYGRILNGLPYIGDAEHISQHDIDSLRSRGIQALLDVPIFIDGQWWGTIGFDDKAFPRIWSTAEVDALVVASNMLAAAVKRVQMDSTLQDELEQRKALIEELEKRNAESETLRESAAIVAASLERSETLSLILEQIARVVPYQSASVQLIVGNMLEIVSSRGVDFVNQDIGTSFPVTEEEPAYPVIQGQLPYILYNDVQTEVPSFNEIPHNNILAWMAVPLKVKGRVMGVITMDGDCVGRFSERDAELAVTYANQAAVALENSRLFSELQVELSLKQNLITELENKNAELERFTYTVSHDLRSPLVTIRGFLGYLERNASEGKMDAFRKDLERISKATVRMDNLLKDVLELSRIGRLVNKPQAVPFDDLLKDALEIVHGRLDARGITLQTQPDLPTVHVDKPRLIEVLQNLIDNAAKYMGDQKQPVIEIGMHGMENGNPIFFVRDNGMGIAPDYHERIFGLFDKLDATSDGTGIGLALVKRIIEFHGGRIWVESEVGKGSTFYFSLAGGQRRS